MTSKTKKIAATVVTGALVLGLSACGSANDNKANNTGTNTPAADTGNTNTGKSDEKITITFQNIYPDPTTPTYKMLHQIVDQYQKDHPNITIELDSMNTDQQKLKLKTQAASKEVPDITIVNPSAQMKPFVDAGLFAPLNDMLDQNGLKDTYQSGLLRLLPLQ